MIKQDSNTGVIHVKRRTDGKILKVADLVEDTSVDRDKIINYLRTLDDIDDMDLIIALNMAKEGFEKMVEQGVYLRMVQNQIC